MTYDSHMAELRRRAAAFHPPGEQLGPVDSQASAAPGQIWETHSRPPFPADLPEDLRTDEPLLVVLLRTNDADMEGHPVHLAAPLFEETRYSGPGDVLLPRHLFGHRKAVAVAYGFTLLGDSLTHCRGILPETTTKALQQFLRALDTGSEPPPQFATGLPYLDEEDVRYAFHEELVDRVDILQISAVTWAEQCSPAVSEEESTTGSKLWQQGFSRIDLAALFPVLAPALSAADIPAERRLETIALSCEAIGAIIQVSQAEQLGDCALEIVDDPDHRLEGAEIQDSQGALVHRLTGLAACFTMPDPPQLIFILRDGTEAVFSPSDEPAP